MGDPGGQASPERSQLVRLTQPGGLGPLSPASPLDVLTEGCALGFGPT